MTLRGKGEENEVMESRALYCQDSRSLLEKIMFFGTGPIKQSIRIRVGMVEWE